MLIVFWNCYVDDKLVSYMLDLFYIPVISIGLHKKNHQLYFLRHVNMSRLELFQKDLPFSARYM